MNSLCKIITKKVKYQTNNQTMDELFLTEEMKDMYTNFKNKDVEKTWIISKDKIDEYFRRTLNVESGKKNYNEFRILVYNDQDFINWSNFYCTQNNIKTRKSKYTSKPILLAGDSWWNWKVGSKKDTGCKDPKKHKFLCESLHYVYKLYSKHKKQDELKKKQKKQKKNNDKV